MSNEPQESPQVDDAEENITADEASASAEATEANHSEAVEPTENDAVQALNDEIATLKEQALRAQADVQNARRRAEKDVESARKFALEKFINELLPVADNLERALTAGNPDDEGQQAVLEGVSLTHKSLVDTLKKFQVEAIDPEGEPFDPQLHQAMSMVPNPDVEPNTVLNVFQKGYTLYGRLVRPAMVVVSSAPPAE